MARPLKFYLAMACENHTEDPGAAPREQMCFRTDFPVFTLFFLIL